MKAWHLAAGALLLAAPAAAMADPISIVAALAPYIGGAAAAAVATAAVFVSTYGGYIYAAYSVYGGIQARRKAKRQAAAARRAYNESLSDRTITTLRADPPWRVVYGRCIVGGDIVAILTSDKAVVREDGSSAVKPDALKHLVVAVAAHQVHDIHEVYVDGIAVGALDGSGWATGGEFGGKPLQVYQERTLAPGAGATFDAAPTVVSAGYMPAGDGGFQATSYSVAGNTVTNTSGFTATISVQYTLPQAVLRWEKHLGADDQLASSYLQGVVPALWTASDRLRGIAYVVVTLDLEEARFQGGPPPLTFDVSGRLLYDPRDASTAWGSNPALVVRDWLTAPWGLRVDAADLDDASIVAAANACDASISLTVGASTTSGATYTADGAVTTEAAPESVLEQLAQSMAGIVTNTGGLWVVNAGAYTPPVLALTEDMQAGAIEVVQAAGSYDDLFNGVRGQMIEAGRAVESDFDPYSNSAYVIDDGAELWTDITLPWTNHRARARNLARIFTEQARESLVIRYPAQLHAWPLQVGDRVTVTSAEYGWAAKVFRVTDWQWSVDSAVLLTLQEDGAAVYDLADAATADQLANTGLPSPYSVPALASVAAASGSAHVMRQGDGSYVPRVRVSWAAVASAYVTDGGRIVARWRRLDADPAELWRLVDAPGDATSLYLVGAGAGDRIVVGVRAVNSLGQPGQETLLSHDVQGDTTPPANATSVAYANVVGGMRVTWAEPGEADYESTEVRQGASWAAGALLWIGNASSFTWTPPTAGSYTLWLVHRDHTGNESTPVSLATAYSVVGASTGGNSATVRMYQREDLGVAPALPSVTLTFDFATGQITAGATAGWSINPPSGGGRFEWVIQAQAYSSSGTDDIAPGEWTAPQIHTRDGIDGEGVYLNDGGFEVAAGSTPWTLGAPGSIVTTSPHQGLQCLRVATTSPLQQQAATNKRFLVVGGQRLELSAYAQRSASANGQLKIGITWRDAAGVDVGLPTDYIDMSAPLSWDPTTWTFTAPFLAVTGELGVRVQGMTAGEFFVDSVALAPGANDGAPGSNAKTVRLSASSQVFSVSEAGAGAPGSITLTANGQNVGGSAAFSVVSGSATLTGSGSTRALAFADMATDQATVRVTWDGLTDDITISKVYAGRSGLTEVMDNAAHALPADAAGAVQSYTGSGTTIQVYEGSTLMQFNTTLAAGRYTVGTPVVSPGGAITVGARSGSGTTTCTVADHSGAATGGPAVIRIAYPIVARRANGTDVSFFITQTLTVVRAGAAGSNGAPGQRGSVAASRQISGSVWSDTEADAAISAAGYGTPQTLDLVTLYNAAGSFSETRVRSGASWITYAARVNGNLLVLGSVTTQALVANAVTAAQDNGGASIVDSLMTGATWVGTETDAITITTTGAPVKGVGYVRVGIEGNVGVVLADGASCQLKCYVVHVRGGVSTTVSAGAVTTARLAAWGPTSSMYAMAALPVTWRHTPAAGSQTYRVRAEVEFRDAAGASVSYSGTLTAFAYLVVEENKV